MGIGLGQILTECRPMSSTENAWQAVTCLETPRQESGNDSAWRPGSSDLGGLSGREMTRGYMSFGIGIRLVLFPAGSDYRAELHAESGVGDALFLFCFSSSGGQAAPSFPKKSRYVGQLTCCDQVPEAVHCQ
ncbi:unnamed protein product [Mycena citricolor]|uniref:Uncharacterized protein n=1 Tax=Mycena citricolor TaxID=2018698 RepID=A0AAD2HK21_9AGAR|nr:unnamed protein product [Mycena citricolor]